MTDWITLHKAADLNGVTYKTISAWCARLEVKTFYVKVPGISGGGNRCLSIADLDRLFEYKRIKVRSSLGFVEDFYLEMKEEMENRGLKLVDLARITEIRSSVLSAYFSGSKLPNLDTIQRMAMALGMKPVLCLMEEVGE